MTGERQGPTAGGLKANADTELYSEKGKWWMISGMHLALGCCEVLAVAGVLMTPREGRSQTDLRPRTPISIV